MKSIAALMLSASVLVGCTTTVTTSSTDAPNFSSAVEALNVYYRSVPVSELPAGPSFLPLDTGKALTRIIVGSCNDEEVPDPAMFSIAKEDADLFLFIGDNVYGDRDGRNYANADAELVELRESYSDLAAQPEFQAIASNMPVLATWDDHDYGMNDFGRDFMGKVLSERMFENFFGLEEEAGDHDGVYYSKMVGPEGQRTQIIMLDTRYFRSDLTPTDEYGKTGKERYIPSTDPDQDMLGDVQWAWLEDELKKPADLRLLVSSIQIIPDVHGWEAWSRLPQERERLYDLLAETEAEGVVFLSGDRHTSFLYKDADRGPYPFYEITASSLNAAFADDPVSPEVDSRQIGKGYTFENYGAIDIDWEAKTIGLSILSNEGEIVRDAAFSFDEIQAG
ncbi:MAG: alkaline phosphatase [Ponticaulis sp.]|nr:alkaline phosphatase [Ponticaulis sp.]|tara:strand:- start:4374 stop:5552 length:1179 start_codon:yes stop_codon:yes gene_type:complete